MSSSTYRRLAHKPAIEVGPPKYVGGYKVKLACPQRDQDGSYPSWTVLAYREANAFRDGGYDAEYVVWTAYYVDDGRGCDGEPGWEATSGDYYGWYGEDRAADATDRFWQRARATAWRPLDSDEVRED